MTENSAISWTTHTFNPWWGCTKVSPACDHCYAEAFDRRVGGAHWGPGVPRRLVKDWSAPRKWNREAERTGVRPRVFTASMADVFDNEVPPEWRVRLFDLIRETPHLDWLIVTKRIGNVRKMVPADWPAAFPHVVLLITVSGQAEAERDVPKLLDTPAAWRGLSIEPMLGPINLGAQGADSLPIYWEGTAADGPLPLTTWGRPIGFAARRGWIKHSGNMKPWLDWVIVGGESGHGARPMHPDWARSVRDQCAAAGVPFHFKQWGEWGHSEQDPPPMPGDSFFDKEGKPIGKGWHFWTEGDRGSDASIRVGTKWTGRRLDGVEHNGMPKARHA